MGHNSAYGGGRGRGREAEDVNRSVFHGLGRCGGSLLEDDAGGEVGRYGEIV